ncbi:NAD(P)-linked oxidoreductase superfamily protein [Rhynchospora pubera]|uniref:NAD(P)-linked oxidoreductase superfamily protein n=1 Tax=Rhynchospora pubera TaxID=906938 RepID=A0AAV8CYW0_9POAL|nr:NAD(P)-linked oxidoreductase superfamily protein [Rhynchospora pubera]
MAIPRVKLGTQGLEVSKLGFGCMGLTGVYNLPLSDEAGISIIKHAFDNGITLFDTSDAYGPHTCEILLGKALKLLPREKVQVATKFGIVSYDANTVEVSGKPEFVRASCEASLKRLGTEYIDLYYQHRVDKNTPIEETIGELKKLVEEGKVKYVGLSEASPDTIRRAHAVHPISALQMEWSLWTREIEPEIVPLCRELGIGIVPYSPLGRGFFGGKGVLEDLSPNTFLHFHPRFMGENLEKNKPVFMQLESLSKKHQCTTAQLALAWVLHQGEDVVPIPGTTKIKNLDDNIGALKLNLSKQDLEEITELVKENEVSGKRTFFNHEHITWRYVNTPPANT